MLLLRRGDQVINPNTWVIVSKSVQARFDIVAKNSLITLLLFCHLKCSVLKLMVIWKKKKDVYYWLSTKYHKLPNILCPLLIRRPFEPQEIWLKLKSCIVLKTAILTIYIIMIIFSYRPNWQALMRYQILPPSSESSFLPIWTGKKLSTWQDSFKHLIKVTVLKLHTHNWLLFIHL